MFQTATGSRTVNLYNNNWIFTNAISGVIANANNANYVVNMKNNIFYKVAGGLSYTIASGSTGLTYENNCAYNMSGVPTGSNNITSDPLFIDFAGGNYNLRPTSPCIDTGTIV